MAIKETKNVAYIAFSDIQVEDWKRYSKNHSRLHHNFKVMNIIEKAYLEHKAEGILFAGDFFDNPKELSNIVASSTFINMKQTIAKYPIYAISGNHDQSESNLPEHSSPSHLELYDAAFKNFNLLDAKKNAISKSGKFKIHGIPYLKYNIGFVDLVNEAKASIDPSKKNILLVHTDFSHIQQSKTRSSGQVENMPMEVGKLFKGFDLVLSGHIHVPQIIRKNVVMLGATHHQRISDTGVDMGYWLIYDDCSYKFKKIKLPQFVRSNVDDGYNFHVPIVEPIKTDSRVNDVDFKSLDIKVLAKNYLITTGDKSKTKLKYLIKYLSV